MRHLKNMLAAIALILLPSAAAYAQCWICDAAQTPGNYCRTGPYANSWAGCEDRATGCKLTGCCSGSGCGESDLFTADGSIYSAPQEIRRVLTEGPRFFLSIASLIDERSTEARKSMWQLLDSVAIQRDCRGRVVARAASRNAYRASNQALSQITL